MRILVDADACPVVKETEDVGQKYLVPVVLFCDTSHILSPDYGEVRVISRGPDAVDFAVVNACQKGDIVVTQDYGVATMALAKGACAIHQDGWLYTGENIDRLLAKRATTKKIRRVSKRHHLHGPYKRSATDDEQFSEALEDLILKLLEEA